LADVFLIVDGNSLIFRAFHAITVLDYKGTYTNAVQGFFMMLFKAVREEKPAYCAVCFDEHAPTFRHAVYPDYKAGRKPTPEELKPQFPLIRAILTAMGLGVISLAGYEADDLLGTLSLNANREGVDALLLTGDRDALQLADNATKVLMTQKGITQTHLFTPDEVRAVYGFTPGQVTDWKGLAGDASDHIPGISGVGDKTAVKLLNAYGSLEGVLENAHAIEGKLGEKIRAGREQAVLSKKLATIQRDVPVRYDMRAFTLHHLSNALPLLEEYGLNVLIRQLSALTKDAPAPDAPPSAGRLKTVEINNLTAITALAVRLEQEGAPTALHMGGALTLYSRGTLYRVQSAYDLLTPGIEPDDALRALTPLACSGRLIVHDGKAAMHRFRKAGINIAAPFFDTLIAQYLINPQERSYSLTHFAREDAEGVYTLYEKQRGKLRAEGLDTLYYNVELPLVKVLYDMEREGFRVDSAVLGQLGQQYEERIAALREEVYHLTGVTGFNLNSPQQLGKVLFEDLGLKHGRKTATGAYSTDADVLEGLSEEHPAIDKVLEYRRLSKLNGTYINGLTRLMGADGRVRTTFDQTATSTGRISSNEPNLQNIPVRTEAGREIRKAFIPRDGWFLLDADYSQIELRILAHLSGDPAMLEAFTLGQDVHRRTASEVYGVPLDAVSPEMRSSAKAVNFGLVYGISEFGLARNIGVSRQEAARFIRTYFSRYPGVKRFMDEAVANGKAEGYAVTLMGRRRYLPELDSNKANIIDFGRRVAMNTPVQGTAADIIKLAMVRVAQMLAEKGFRARLILQVHDELLLECPPEECGAVAVLLRDAMENAADLKIPLVAEVSQGLCWYETK